MEAEKIKKRLHGSILKGSKIHVEAARTEKSCKKTRQEEVADEGGTSAKKVKKPKAKREEGVLPGYELPENRKVKRGWTEPPSKDNKASKRGRDKSEEKTKPKKSSFTDRLPECLFKTSVPPNATNVEKTSRVRDGKVRKTKRGDSNRITVVHEFENATKHTRFLRNDKNTDGSKPISKFVDDVGWVDEEGNVVEPVPHARRSKKKVDTTPILSDGKPSKGKEDKRSTDGPATSRTPAIEDDETSSSGISSSESDSEVDNDSSSSTASPVLENNSVADFKPLKTTSDSNLTPKQTRTPPHSLSITRSSATPPPSSPQPAKHEIHPLEALFKRPSHSQSHPQTPKKPTLELHTFFSDVVDQDHETTNGTTKVLVPQTPFTQQDFRQRRQRSAAPTPDTAMVGRGFGFGFGGDESSNDEEGVDEEAESEDNSSTPLGNKKSGEVGGEKGKEESEFSKWFWEHRGETNRAWKKRKREVGKEKRKRENRERAKGGRRGGG